MRVLKFSHAYSKLEPEFDGKRALLLAVGRHFIEDLPGKFLDYDTHYLYWDNESLCEGFYPLMRKVDVLVLCFVDEDGLPFTTIRMWTFDKERYYSAGVGEYFTLKLESNNGVLCMKAIKEGDKKRDVSGT
jgi:hypothetical protein